MPLLAASHVPVGSLSTIEQPQIMAGELLLRPWTEADADALMAAYADPEIQRWHVQGIDSRAEAAEMIAGYNRGWRAETSAHWAVTDPDIVGRVALKGLNLADGCAEIAYWVTAAARGRGVAVRAIAALSTWAFNELGFHRIGLGHSVENAASCRVAQKAGFAYEGTARSAFLHADGFHDVHRHARIKGDA